MLSNQELKEILNEEYDSKGRPITTEQHLRLGKRIMMKTNMRNPETFTEMRARQKKAEDKWVEGAPERERKAEEDQLRIIEIDRVNADRRARMIAAGGSDPFPPNLYYLFGGG